MIKRPFNVNDAALRETFLRTDVGMALADLREDTPAQWGRMTAAQMVEHLLWAMELSTGHGHVACEVPPEELARMKRFLYSNRPTPQEFMNPVLVSGPEFESSAPRRARQRGLALLVGGSTPRRSGRGGDRRCAERRRLKRPASARPSNWNEASSVRILALRL